MGRVISRLTSVAATRALGEAAGAASARPRVYQPKVGGWASASSALLPFTSSAWIAAHSFLVYATSEAR